MAEQFMPAAGHLYSDIQWYWSFSPYAYKKKCVFFKIVTMLTTGDHFRTKSTPINEENATEPAIVTAISPEVGDDRGGRDTCVAGGRRR